QWLSGNPFKIIQALIKSDIFVLGGGGIIRVSNNYKNLWRLLDEIWVAKLLGKKVFIYGVSIGPINSHKGYKIIKNTLRKCDFITVRDHKSIEYLERFGIEKEKYSLTADPAFIPVHLENSVIENQELRRAIIAEKKIPIFLALGLIKGGNDLTWLRPLARALDSLSITLNVSFIAIPFRRLSDCEIDDVYIARELKSQLQYPNNLTCYLERIDYKQLSSVIINALSGVIAIRLHSLILSVASKTPFVAINYDTKVMDTAILAGLESQVVELSDNFEDDFIAKVSDMLDNKAELTEKISMAADLMLSRAEQNFTLFNKILES
ncbi:MAG: polysaccharide pyruvyl transferase family protein, partial [Nitrososphaeraceae archaeon]